ncbi:glycosyltransferase [Paenibacillus sp. MMS18-CY102]|uniref:glycosyltransferase n=1 Tax=Paenibacillus sp. MMS18-CY102 TaxID=2682849 RepID=UPI0013656B6A|nr:glycosyltransferase [Paenibacillus sp. MMS18-CY102]MWC29510.1 glycosyltransferase [Paenibacillus sp. MMS18-CY102]
MTSSTALSRSKSSRAKRRRGSSGNHKRFTTAKRRLKKSRTSVTGKRRRLASKKLSKKRAALLARRRRDARRRKTAPPVHVHHWDRYESDPQYGTFNPGHTEVDPPAIDRRPLSRPVTIIILTWNGLDYTRKCFEHLAPTLEPGLVDVIVFDNGSTDGTVEYLRTIPWIRPLFNPTNIGFVAGNHAALPYARPDSDIVLLNNDILTEQGDWLSKLQETAYRSRDIGIVGARLRGPDGSLHHAGTYILPDNLSGQQIGGEEPDVRQYNGVRDVQGIVFACAYLKRELIQRIGFLDQDYFSYFEDTDYCLKAIMAGYRVVNDGRVTLHHYHNTSTRVNGVDFWDMYNKSREVFRSKWQNLLQMRYERPLNWRSVVHLPLYGYTETSKNLMLGLERQHLKVNYEYVYGPGTPMPFEEPETGPDMRVNLFKQRTQSPEAVEVVYGQGDVFYKNKGRYKIGYTMLEVDGLPHDWVAQSNSMNEVWVPSHFNAQTFRNSGVTVPIHVMPLGVDTNYFHPGIRSKRFSDKFTFLSVFEWGERKAPELLLETFSRVFAHRDDVLLVCKIINNDPSFDVPTEIRKLKLGAAAERILVLHNDKIPSAWMGSLYRSADCFVLPTRGEGWGMPIMEAMACGLPVIATNWSAQTEFINESNAYPLRVERLIPAEARCVYYHGFNWAQPDAEHLAHLMQHVVANREEAAERGRRAAIDMQSQFTWDHSAARMKGRLAGL